jgi:Tfp pilus assembly protein PilE
MYGQGWVRSNADLQKIRRQEKKREEQKKDFEDQQQQGKDKVAGAGLRQFGASTSEVCDARHPPATGLKADPAASPQRADRCLTLASGAGQPLQE